MSVPFELKTKPFVTPKTPEELGLDVNTQGIYAMCETTWMDAMIGQYARTGVYTLQFGVGDTTSGTMINRFGSLSSSKNLEEQKFFIDAIPNPDYRDHALHRVIRETFAYQVSNSKDKREVFAVAISEALAQAYINTGEFEPIRQWLSDQIRKCASKLNKDHAKLSVKLRDIQANVLKKIVNTINKHGIGTNVIAELAPRLGKTILFLMTAKELQQTFGHQSMFVLAYGVGLSVKASYAEEIRKFQDFDNFVFIDNANNNAQKLYEEAIAQDKFPVVFVSLNAKIGDGETEERLDWISKRNEKSIALLEETDFGVHTDSQVEKTQFMFKHMTVTQINSSGTNIGRIAKASGDNPADAIIRVPYCMVEQDGSIPNIVKRKFYNMVFAQKMNSLLEGFDKEVLPNITKILADAKTQEKFLTALFQDLYGYQPIYGLNINRQANEIIEHTMLFTNITKKQMSALGEVIEKACSEHKVLILNGEETSNKEAEGRTFEELVAIQNGKYPGRNKLLVMTNMMGTRSYSIPQIQACLFMMEGGDVYPYMQRYSRCLTPGFGKEYGHIFDFAFDTNKTRNTEMSIAIEAAAVMEQKGISFPDAVREVMFSVNIKDIMSGKWLDATDIIKRFEDNDKLVEVANALSRLHVEDFDDTDFPFLVELAKRAMSKKEKSDFEKTIKTGKTYEKKKREGVDTTPEEDKEYLKALDNMKKTIERAIRALNSSASTVAEFANYEGKTYEQCLDIIEKDVTLGAEFFEMYGVGVEFVKSVKHKLPLPTLDLIVEGTIRGNSENNISNSSLGIVADDPELWREIFSTRAMRRMLNSNKCKRILVVAGGLGTEIDVLVELHGFDILDKIVYNDKYTCFCNRIKRKYPEVTIVHGNFLELEIDMKFDVVIGNPPYRQGTQHAKKIWPDFTAKSLNLLKDNGMLGWVIPTGWLDSNNAQMKKIRTALTSEYNLLLVDRTADQYFDVGTEILSLVANKTPYQAKTKYKSFVEEYTVDLKKGLNKSAEEKLIEGIENKILNCGFEFFNMEHEELSNDIEKTQTEINKYWVIYSTANRGYSATKPKNTGKLKIGLNVSSSFYSSTTEDNNMPITTDAIGGLMYYIPLESIEQGKNIKSFLSSKLIRFFASVYKRRNSGFCHAVRQNRIPKIDSTKKWSDEEVFALFNITKEEQEYINEQLA